MGKRAVEAVEGAEDNLAADLQRLSVGYEDPQDNWQPFAATCFVSASLASHSAKVLVHCYTAGDQF